MTANTTKTPDEWPDETTGSVAARENREAMQKEHATKTPEQEVDEYNAALFEKIDSLGLISTNEKDDQEYKDAILTTPLAGHTLVELVKENRHLKDEHNKCVCVYCQTPFNKHDPALPEHIFTCEKSPLVRLMGELKKINNEAESTIIQLQPQLKEANDALWECCKISGADTSGGIPTSPSLAVCAVQDVKELRENSDKEITQLQEELALLRKFATHKESCSWKSVTTCECGYNQSLATLREKKGKNE